MTKIRTLIVDDNHAFRTSVYDYLQLAGLDPAMCGYGQDGLDLTESEEFDVALVDVTLPDLTGWEVASHLREQGFGGPIIMWSGSNRDEDRLEGSGADWFLLKPFDAGGLVDLIGHLIDKQ